MIKANCPKCGNGGHFEDRFAGLNARCARCQTRFVIPVSPTVEEPPPLPEEELLSVEDEESPTVPKKDGMSAIVKVPPPLPASLPATPPAGAAPKPSVPIAQPVAPPITKTKKFAQWVGCALKGRQIIVYSAGTFLLVLLVFWMLWPQQGRGIDPETARIDALINQMFINDGFVIDRTRSGAGLWTGQCWIDPDPPPEFENSSAGYGTYASFEEYLIEEVWNAERASTGETLSWKGQPKNDEDSEYRFLLALQTHYVRRCRYYEQRSSVADRGRANYLQVQFMHMKRDHINYVEGHRLIEKVCRKVEVLYVGQAGRLGPKAAADFIKTISEDFHALLQARFRNAKTGTWVYPAADSGWKPDGPFDPTGPNARTVAVGVQEPAPNVPPSHVSKKAPVATPAGNAHEKPMRDVRPAVLLKGHDENASNRVQIDAGSIPGTYSVVAKGQVVGTIVLHPGGGIRNFRGQQKREYRWSVTNSRLILRWTTDEDRFVLLKDGRFVSVDGRENVLTLGSRGDVYFTKQK